MKRKRPMKQLNKYLILFLTGGTTYYLIEFIWKNCISHSNTHWSMFLLGGICFLVIGGLNNWIPWEMSIIKQGCIGAGVVTVLEFIFGILLNIILKLNIWDYSTLPLNILGQICLPFTIIWFFLALIAILVDDYLRYKWFNEEYPHYHWRSQDLCK